jgi:hypothetical protein
VLLAVAVLPIVAACDSTAPNHCVTVEGQLDPQAPDLMVSLRNGVDPIAMSDTLAARYGFTPSNVYDWSNFFTIPAPQPAAVLAGLRCEPSVQAIEYDQHTNPGPP